MHFAGHALTMTSAAGPELGPVLAFRMVGLSLRHGVCGVSAFAFARHGAWLAGGPNPQVEEGHRMGQVATEMMYLLGAVDVSRDGSPCGVGAERKPRSIRGQTHPCAAQADIRHASPFPPLSLVRR